MNLTMLGLSLFLAITTYNFWHVVREREIRWKLFAIRDDLRWYAIQHPSFGQSPEFLVFDGVLSSCARSLHCTSLWTLIPVMLEQKNSERDPQYDSFVETVRGTPELYALLGRMDRVLQEHLRIRHWIIPVVSTVVRPVGALRTEVSEFIGKVTAAIVAQQQQFNGRPYGSSSGLTMAKQ